MKCQYYKEFENKKILVAAPLPKPYGGVSIHAQRLKNELEFKGNKVSVYQAHLYRSSIAKGYALMVLIIRNKPEVLISHTSYHGILETFIFIFLRMLWFNNWVLVDHDCRYLDTRSILFRWMHSQACYVADTVVLMGETIKELYKRHSIYPKNVRVEFPYISPSSLEFVNEKLSPEVNQFLLEHGPVLLINGSCFMKDAQGRDLYGFDVALNLIKELKNSYPKVGLIILLAQNNDQSYFNVLAKKIYTLGLAQNVLWLIGDYYLPSIVSQVTLMIRPTTSENFGISVAEAIDLGIPVVASDCCARYPGTFVYQCCTYEDLERSVQSVLCLIKS